MSIKTTFPSDPRPLAQRWIRVCRALPLDARLPYIRLELGAHEMFVVADALDRICTAAELSQPDARAFLVSFVDTLNRADATLLRARLRAEAQRSARLSLARLVRRSTPLASSASIPPPSSSRMLAARSIDTAEARVPDYGKGRPLTLGERKALARRPHRASLEKLLADPHPMVIRTLLDNSRLVEDDIVRLCARRPARPALLEEVARNLRWAHRVRVRLAIVLNPDTPMEVSIPMAGLLVRSELTMLIKTADLPPLLRATAREKLAKRSPLKPVSHERDPFTESKPAKRPLH